MALPHQHTKALVQESLGTHSSTLIAPHTHTHTHTHPLCVQHILMSSYTHLSSLTSHTGHWHTTESDHCRAYANHPEEKVSSVCVCVVCVLCVLWVYYCRNCPRDSCTRALVCWWGRAISSSLWTLLSWDDVCHNQASSQAEREVHLPSSLSFSSKSLLSYRSCDIGVSFCAAIRILLW